MSLHGNNHVNTYGGFMAKIYEIKTKGESYTFKTYDNGVEYVYRIINKSLWYIYDLASYKEALENKGLNPIQIGTYEFNEDGTQVFKQIVN